MKYKILSRIMDGQKTIGYQLLSEDGKTLNIPKDQVIGAAASNLIINATYNKNTKTISGIGCDLRKLKCVSYSDIVKDKAKAVETKETDNEPYLGVLDTDRSRTIDGVIYELIRKTIITILKHNGIDGVNVTEFKRDATYPTPTICNYKLEAKSNPYIFYTGYLAILCNLSETSGYKDITFELTNEYDHYVEYINGGGFDTHRTLTTFGAITYRLADNLSGKFERYNNRGGDFHFSIVDGYSGQLLTREEAKGILKQTIVSLDAFIKTTKKAIIDHLFDDGSKDELDPPKYKVVESKNSGLYSFPSAKGSVNKAFEFEKKGYKIIVEDTLRSEQMTAAQFKNKCEEEVGNSGYANSYSASYYDYVSEYVDEKNKIFYCKLGRIRTADFWC